ncbi:hypothetical protein LTR84_006246 [Exophiala bonariae]|uniref:protein-tyrosine-phosphatase n=1 Tax=Exophiala bonariae TaxID=1690606 RepID=A0AAV9N5S0_9EURO|nr:hypothetical protein LTR84_006246 [Exophiala bonariae]
MLALFAPLRPGHPRRNKSIIYGNPTVQPSIPRPKIKDNMASTTSAPLLPDQIIPGVYLSDSIQTARAVLSPNYQTPNRPKIRYILSLLNATHQQPQMLPSQEPDFVMKLIMLRDNNNENLLQVLDEACNFIKSSLGNKDGGVLIHCHQGVSRSASVMIAFVMEEMDLEYETALRYVRQGRPKVNPNPGFVAQLEMWHRLQYNIREKNGELKQEYIDWGKTNKAREAKELAGTKEIPGNKDTS